MDDLPYATDRPKAATRDFVLLVSCVYALSVCSVLLVLTRFG